MSGSATAESTSRVAVGEARPHPRHLMRLSSVRTIWRARVIVACVALTALCFHQAPGLIVPDTKLDLTADPGGFLLRALHLWDPQGAFGQLQNQAYGYLLPMGPFHWLLTEVGLPAWTVQRLWWSLILCVAFVGMWRLSGVLGMGAPWARYAAAFLYALSPRMLSEVAITSVEVWPIAMAPWVLLPLVRPEPRTWWWRISRSALAFALVGGVNAVATGATLVLPALWFATRRRKLRTLLAGLAWLGTVVVAMLWWFVPLLIMGRYSPPFLDWIEDAKVTTGTASIFQSFRGTSAWLGFLRTSAGPSWPAGWQFATSTLLIFATVLVASIGLVGLASRWTHERLFLLSGLVVGLLLLTLGHTGAAQSPLAPALQTVLDGPLAALRNTHKFELVVRLPLMLGVSVALTRVGWWMRRSSLPALLAPFVTGCLVVVMASPALAGQAARPEAYSAIPADWHQAAQWLDQQRGPGSVLVLPAASFADFTWGSTKDSPLQPLMKRPFAVRDAVPLGSAGATRWLDEIERRMGSGLGGPEVQDALREAGVGYVLVRNDLRLDAQGDPPVAIHQALARSGMKRVASFGPPVGVPGESVDLTVDERTIVPFPSIEIFGVSRPRDAAMIPRTDLASLDGGPEDVPGASAVSPAAAFVVGRDVTAVPDLVRGQPHIVTDGQRLRAVNFGAPTHNLSQVLPANTDREGGTRVRDYDSDPAAARTVLQWGGKISAVTASSSASDPHATLRTGPANSPAAALDGDPGTRWISGTYGAVDGEWLQVDLREPIDPHGLRVTTSDATPVGSRPSTLQVSTDAGTETTVLSGSPSQTLAVPAGPTRMVRVSAVSHGEGVANGFSISELSIPGLTPVHPRLATRASAPADTVVLRRQVLGRAGCLYLGQRPLCAQRFAAEGEEAAGMWRELTLPAAGTYSISGTVLPKDGPALEALLDRVGATTASASSRSSAAPAGRPDAMVDHDLGTGWVAGPEDLAPTITLTLPKARTISGLQFLVDPYLAASPPHQVTITIDGTTTAATVDAEGYVRFLPRRAKVVEVAFGATRAVVDINSDNGLRSWLPVGVSEVRVLGADDFRRPIQLGRPTGVVCGFGPDVVVNGAKISTRVVGTVADVLQGRPMRWVPCGTAARATLSRGVSEVSSAATAEFLPTELVLRSTRQGAIQGKDRAVDLSVSRHGPASASVEVPARSEASVVMLGQNFNRGWMATDSAGARVTPVRMNGWQQGWVIPAGGATILTAHFAPDTGYRIGLAGGGAVLVALLILMLLPWRGERRPRARAAAPGRLTVGVMALLASAAMAGWVGAVAVALGLVTTKLGRGKPGLIPLVIIGAGLAASAVSAGKGVLPGLASPVLQGCVLFAVAIAVSWLAWGSSSSAVEPAVGDGETS